MKQFLFKEVKYIFILLLCLMASCTDSDLKDDVDELKDAVSALQNAVTSLQNAVKENKSVRSVTPFTADDESGWVITFSDNTSIRLTNGKDGTDGNDGANGSDGTGSILHSIKQDNESRIITLTLTDGSAFAFNLHISPATGLVALANTLEIEAGREATIHFRVNPSDAVFDYDVAKGTNQVVLDKVGETKANYITTPTNYALTKIEPALNEKGETMQGQYKATIKDLGKSSTYKELITLVLSAENEQGEMVQYSSSIIEVTVIAAGPESVLTAFSFTKTANPTKILNSDITATLTNKEISAFIPYVTDFKGLKATFSTDAAKMYVNGVEQESGVTVNDFTSPVTYELVSATGVRSWYTVTLSNSGLPVVTISTPNSSAITSKEVWTEGSDMTIAFADGTQSYSGKTSIRGRGNSTWGYPKKPYALKLDSKSEVLGMPGHKRWVLLANWMDRTLLRNHVSFQIAKQTNLAWTPRGQFVEVVLNGRHVGNYYLCEQIKGDKNRVNITEMKAADVSGDAVTGGYLLEFDTNYDEINKFRSATYNMPVMFKEPDEEVLQSAQFTYMQNYINQIEGYLASNNYTEVQKLIDIESFIDWWLVYEVARNAEPNHPRSSYMHKDRNGKLFAGPVWDFDWATFIPSTAFAIKGAIWYTPLFRNAAFVQAVKSRWAVLKPKFTAIDQFIADEAERIRKSDSVDAVMWPLIGQTTNGDETLSFDAAVTRMRDTYKARLTWLDAAINAL